VWPFCCSFLTFNMILFYLFTVINCLPKGWALIKRGAYIKFENFVGGSLAMAEKNLHLFWYKVNTHYPCIYILFSRCPNFQHFTFLKTSREGGFKRFSSDSVWGPWITYIHARYMCQDRIHEISTVLQKALLLPFPTYIGASA